MSNTPNIPQPKKNIELIKLFPVDPHMHILQFISKIESMLHLIE